MFSLKKYLEKRQRIGYNNFIVRKRQPMPFFIVPLTAGYLMWYPVSVNKFK